MIPAPGSIPTIFQSTASPNSSLSFKSSIELMSSTYDGTVNARGAASTNVPIISTSSPNSSQYDLCVAGNQEPVMKSADPSATLDHIAPASTCLASTL